MTKTAFVVDDSRSAGMVMSNTLRAAGLSAELCICTSIEDFMALLAEIERKNPDVIFIDQGMPVFSGTEICLLLKENPATRHIPVHMVSGDVGFSARLTSKQAGLDGHTAKPLTKAYIESVLTQKANG